MPLKSVAAVRAERPPVLDGHLDDPVWQQAGCVEDLHVVVSNEHGEPSERSRIYVAWSWENFLQYDNDSETIGINSILRWIPRAGRETVLAIKSQLEDFDRDRNFHSLTSDLTLKLSHTFRF